MRQDTHLCGVVVANSGDSGWLPSPPPIAPGPYGGDGYTRSFTHKVLSSQSDRSTQGTAAVGAAAPTASARGHGGWRAGHRNTSQHIK